MTARPSGMPSREVLTGYLVALMPPSLTCLDEQLTFLEAEFVRVQKRAHLDGQLTAWRTVECHNALVDEDDCGNCDRCDQVASLRAAIAELDNPLQPTPPTKPSATPGDES